MSEEYTSDPVFYTYEDAPTLDEFSRSDAFIRGIMGPFGSGKSSACCIEIVSRGQRQQPHPRSFNDKHPEGVRRTKFAAVRNTYRQLEDSTIRTFMRWFPPLKFGTWRAASHNYVINKIRGCEIEICFRALDRPDQVDNLLSTEYTAAWFNEARDMPWTIIETMSGRVGRFPPKDKLHGFPGATWSGIFMDTNPPDDDSEWYAFFEESDFKPHEAAVFKQPSGLSEYAENKSNLGDGYYDRMMIRKDEDWIRVYVHGEYGFVREGMPVYPLYRDGIHCRPFEVDFDRNIILGWDFGLTPAVVVCQIAKTGQFRVLDELCVPKHGAMGIKRFAREVVGPHLMQNFTFHFVTNNILSFGDRAGSSREPTDLDTCFKTINDEFRFVTVPAHTNSFITRKESVDDYLMADLDGEPGIIVHPRCRVLRKGFRGRYHYERIHVVGKRDRYKERPKKDMYSHPHDGLQYACLMARQGIDGAVMGDSSGVVGGLTLEKVFA